MPKSRVLALLSIVALTVVLAACGNEDNADPTPNPTETTLAATEAKTETESAASTDISATPVETESSAAVASPATARPAATAVSDAAPVTPILATFLFGGAEQRDYLMTDEGCVGLGEYSQLKPGTQVVVRDASGTVVDVTTLEAADDTADCSWTAELSVPESDYVSISIPMVTEIWFSQDDLESGNVSISFP